MIFTTMRDAVTELSPRINGGTCRAETAMARINQATRRIMNRPRKPVHVERVVRFFSRKDTITLPREVEKIKHYAMDGSPAPLFGTAYEFVSGGWGELCCSPGIPGKFLVDRGNFHSTMFDLPCMETGETEYAAGDPQGRVQSCREPAFSAFKLVAFSTSRDDVTKALSVYGRGEKNESLGEGEPCLQLPIHEWSGGVEGEIFMDLASKPDPNFALSVPVRDIERVAKPRTAGFVSLYSYDEATHQMYFLSKYHPQETNPRYRRYRITSPDYVLGSSVYALCELGYVPLESLDDVLIVQNLDALKMMVMAIEFENERDFKSAKAYEADAYRLIEEQRSGERTHDYNLIQTSKCYGFGDVRAR